MEGRKWTRERLRNAMLENARKEIDAGLRQAREQQSGNPKRRVQLIEIIRGEELDEEYIRQRVRDGIMSLTSLDESWHGLKDNVNLYMRAMERRDRIIVVEDLMSFERQGVKVWLSIDLMMRAASGPTERCVIVDWKTGKRKDADVLQVHLYRTFALDRKWKDASMLLAYLRGDGTDVVHVSSDEDSAAIVDRSIAEYVDALRPMLVDGDVKRNEPIESKFVPTDDPAICDGCAFAAVCERDGTKPPAGRE